MAHKQYAVLVELEGMTPNWVEVRLVDNPCEMIGSTSVLNEPDENYTYSAAELPSILAYVRKAYPTAYVAAHEVGHVDMKAMRSRWSGQHDKWKAAGHPWPGDLNR